MRVIVLPPEDQSQVLGALYAFRYEIRELVLLAGTKGEEKKRVDRFAEKLRRYAARRKLPWKSVKVLPFDETLPQAFVALRQRYLGDGTPPTLLSADAAAATSITAARLFSDARLAAYDAYDNRLTLFEKESIRHETAERMDLREYCAMLGYALESAAVPGVPETREKVLFLFRNERAFARVRRSLLAGEPVDRGDPVVRALESLGILREGRVPHNHAMNRLKGGLFEEYVYHLCEEEGFDDLALACRVDFTPGVTEGEPVLNEFDILFIHNNRIGTVECKYTRDHFNARKFLYQYDTVMDYFGKTARALLLNLYQNDGPSPERTRRYADTIMRRARFGNVRLLSMKRFDESRFKAMLRWMKEEGNNLAR